MRARKRSANEPRDRKQLLDDSKKALKLAEQTLKLELKKVAAFKKALDFHNPFPF